MIREDIAAGRAQLWIVWDGNEIIAAATTELIQMPSKKVCVLGSCAGRDLRKWDHFLADLEAFAKREGCDRLRIYGRPGWKRILARNGYQAPWDVLEKAL
jgi:hypothetical protein